jgi:hypothetical protein
MDAGNETRPPRGALIAIAIGLIACVAAAVLSTDEPIGAAEVAWGASMSIPVSGPSAIPGGGTMRIGQAELRATPPNGSGYRLYRIAAMLETSKGAAVGHGRARCLVRVPAGALVARTPNGRAAYPQPSEDLAGQPVARDVKIEFNIEGTDLAAVSLRDAFGRFANEPGVKAEWTKYESTRQGWDWGLPGGRPAQPLALAFATVLRAPVKPTAGIACTVTTGAGKAAARTTGTP